MPKTSTSPSPIETYWTVDQVAARLQVSVDCVRTWLRLRKIDRTKAGARTLISETNLQTFLRRSTKEAA